ncbi:hypothetical protein CEXT_513021, partial [Caerostris extrusa]
EDPAFGRRSVREGACTTNSGISFPDECPYSRKSDAIIPAPGAGSQILKCSRKLPFSGNDGLKRNTSVKRSHQMSDSQSGVRYRY